MTNKTVSVPYRGVFTQFPAVSMFADEVSIDWLSFIELPKHISHLVRIEIKLIY